MKQGDQVYARTDVYGIPKSTVDAVFVADNGDGTVTVAHRVSDALFVVDASDVAPRDPTDPETCEDRDYRCCEADLTPADERGGDDWYERHLAAYRAQQGVAR